jgi:2-oxoglutarate dehydrogenase E2 component (dihydrolipoamide succinyltransferase)
MYKIVLPKINNNDESYLLMDWLVNSGEAVKKEDEIAVFETSKAAFDLNSDADGILHQVSEAGSDCKPGDILGYMFNTEAEWKAFIAQQSAGSAAIESSQFTLTKGAQELVETYSISTDQLATLNRSIIKRSHVESLIEQSNLSQQKTIDIPKSQLAVARVVSRSHQQVPKAFLLIKVYCDRVNQALQEHIQHRDNVLLGLPELLIKATASLYPKFPFFFGSVVENEQFEPAAAAHIGITLDLGKGLFIPVVLEADTKTLPEIADTLMAFRLKAMRGNFQEADLSGGSISISLNTDTDSLVTLPIILPGQTCMLTLNSCQDELFLNASQQVETRTYCHLGLAYDHRVINGYDASQFLTHLKVQIEQQPEVLLSPSD